MTSVRRNHTAHWLANLCSCHACRNRISPMPSINSLNSYQIMVYRTGKPQSTYCATFKAHAPTDFYSETSTIHFLYSAGLQATPTHLPPSLTPIGHNQKIGSPFLDMLSRWLEAQYPGHQNSKQSSPYPHAKPNTLLAHTSRKNSYSCARLPKNSDLRSPVPHRYSATIKVRWLALKTLNTILA